MKKFLALMMMIVMALTVAACGGGGDKKADNKAAAGKVDRSKEFITVLTDRKSTRLNSSHRT